MKIPLIRTTSALAGILFSLSASAAITGFGDGTGFTVNRVGGAEADTPIFTDGTLRLTTSTGGLATSAWSNTRQSYQDGFIAAFTYSTTAGADGFGFVLQNVGTAALGATGGGKGYGGTPFIDDSVAVLTNIYQAYTIGYGVNGSQESFQTPGFDLSTAPVNYVITYDPSTAADVLSVTLAQGEQVFSRDYTVGNLATILSSEEVFVGFTGGTGGVNATQQISNFTFTPVPEPGSVALLGLAVLGMAARRRR